MLKYKPHKREKYDLLLTLGGKKKTIIKQLKTQLQKRRGIKWFMCVKVKMVKTSPDGKDQTSEPHFRSVCMTAVNETEIEKNYDQAVEKIKNSFLEYQREGSGWRLEQVLQLELGVATYTPLKGASYLPLPKKLNDKRAIINIMNDDEKCFCGPS